MSTKDFVLALARGARGKDAAKALILPQIFGGTGYVNAGTDLTVSGTPPLSLPNSLGKPLKAWSVDVVPYQEGTGDPAPDNVRRIHGTDKVTITTAGKNLLSSNYSEYNVNYSYAYITDCFPSATCRITLVDKDTTVDISDCSIGFQNWISQSQIVPSEYNWVISYGNVLSNMTNVKNGIVCTGIMIYPKDEVTFNKLFARYDIMVELGTTATEFTPYLAPSQTVLTLPQTVYTGTVGSDGGESRWGEVDLGTLTYTHYESSGRQIFRTAPISDIKGPTSISLPINAICEAYTPKSYNATWTDGIFAYAYGYTGANQLAFVDNRFTTVDDFKTAVTGIKLVYELETPVQFSLTTPPIPTPTGSATTWAVAEDGTVGSMSVTYIGKSSS